VIVIDPSNRKNPYLSSSISQINDGLDLKDQSLFAATELLEKIECLGIIANQHYFVVCLGANLMQEPFISSAEDIELESRKIIPF
jgi:hypothetical protein